MRFFSEAVSVHGRLFYPPGFAPTGASPAVVLAPGWGETAAAVERQAEQFAVRGIVALAIDIRNAITFLQGEPGVDPERIGVWGTGVSGAHVVALAATDARVKAGVAVTPGTVGQGSDRLSFSPTVPQRTDLVRLALPSIGPLRCSTRSRRRRRSCRLPISRVTRRSRPPSSGS